VLGVPGVRGRWVPRGHAGSCWAVPAPGTTPQASVAVVHIRQSCYVIRLVDDPARATAADGHEDGLVEPVERGRPGLDPRSGPEGVLVQVDLLAAAQAGEDIDRTVADTCRTHIEQIPAVGPQRIADVPDRCPIAQDGLPVGTRPGDQRPLELRT